MKKYVVSGTDYDMGYKVGNIFKEYLCSEIKKYDEKILNENVYSKVKELELKLKNESSNCLEEIYGRADGAGVDRESLLLMFFPEIYKKVDGCTTLILKNKDNKFLFSHNEDDKNYTTENTALIKYDYGNYWIVGYTMAEKLTGSSFAYNSYGLVFSSNYIYDTKIELDNISRYIMVRNVMNARTLDEAIEILKSSKVASAFSLNILDTKMNKAINIEKDIEEIYMTSIEDRYARANHFIAKENDLTEKPISSKFRNTKTNELIKNIDQSTAKIEDLKTILNYETEDYYKSVFKDPKKYADKSVTVANFSYDGANNFIEINDYLGDSELKFKYEEF